MSRFNKTASFLLWIIMIYYDYNQIIKRCKKFSYTYHLYEIRKFGKSNFIKIVWSFLVVEKFQCFEYNLILYLLYKMQ